MLLLVTLVLLGGALSSKDGGSHFLLHLQHKANHFSPKMHCIHWIGNIIALYAVWVVRWPCSILAIAVKILSHGKTIFLRLFFLCSFSDIFKIVAVLIFLTRHFSCFFFENRVNFGCP